MALAKREMLLRYVAGVPTHAEATAAWQRPFLRRQLVASAIDLDPRLVRQVFVAPLVRRAAARLGTRAAAADWSHRGEAWFDRIAAKHIARVKPSLVVCYENAALETFKAAKKFGAITVLDAASYHHAWQDRHYDPIETERVHRRICRRKDAEIALADHVLTVSDLARESYVEAGVAEDWVTAIRVGADLAAFKPRASTRRPGPLRFVFVGHIGRRKGIDVLVDAAQQLAADGVGFEVATIGRRETGFDAPLGPLRELGWMPSSDLAAELTEHDVLILPSRHDSFGMVVAEAMACGLPAIVSTNVGARELVKPNKNGRIVPAGQSEPLKEAMKWFGEQGDALDAMSSEARAAAQDVDWSVYERNAAEHLSRLLASPQRRCVVG